MTTDAEIAQRRYRQGLPARWPVLAPLALLGMALILRIIDIHVLRLDELLGEIILSKSLGFALVVGYTLWVGQHLPTIGLHSRRLGPAIAIVAGLTMASFLIATFVQILTLAPDQSLILRAVDPKTGMTGGVAFAMLLLTGNVINGFMEEGLFRGVMLPHFLQRMRFRRANHVYLDLDADFAGKRLKGYFELDLKRIDPAASILVLDTKALDIAAVELVTSAGLAPAKWEMGSADETFGTPLTIDIGTAATKVRITYATTDGSDGLNWADPAQTNDKKHPFMYSLSQSIYGRTWFPQQDTPKIRVTYAADITTPKDLLALMSADNDPNAARDGSYHFEMPQTVVPYLIAIAVGDLHFQAISDRAGVYAEAGMLEKAGWEFADSEEMIQAVEGLYGPYQWGRYDLLIMPPSFPFGGMEHARLSFITPTVITGDRGLVDLISHELSHSWSGNYVTNGTWRDLWLNEGVTSYVENRVIEALYGKERADMDLEVNYEDGLAAVKDLPPEAQLLAIDLRGQHPDAVFSDIPYTKGMLFFKFLEDRVGRADFDAFLKQYFEDFAWGTITTDVFETYLKGGLLKTHPDAFTDAEIAEWIHQPGYPAFGPVPKADGYAVADQTLAKLVSGEMAPKDVDTEGWMIQQQLRLIKDLPMDMDPAKLAELDTALDLSTTGNLKLAYEWLLYAAKAGYIPALDARFERLMTEQGRIAFTKDLYEAVLAIDPERAKAVYAKAKPGYHPITVWEIDQVFK